MAEKRLTPVARRLRQDGTDVERLLWQRLRSRQVEGAKFVRQFPIGDHVADFACRASRLVVELDGGQHGASPDDADRTRMIEAHGFTIVRFWNGEVTDNLEGVLEQIARNIRIARNGPP